MFSWIIITLENGEKTQQSTKHNFVYFHLHKIEIEN